LNSHPFSPINPASLYDNNTMTALTKMLALYIWLGIEVLVLLLNRIARFYELTTGIRTHYRLFLFPVGFFFLGMLRYLFSDMGFAGDVLGDVFFFLGGVSLALLGYYLLQLMTGGRS
jgi:hypothetical protein